MSDTADRYRRLAADFTARAERVPDDAWDRPSPCEGWSARDVVRHMVETSRFFAERVGIPVPEDPTVESDPVGAWVAARDAIQRGLDDPEIAGKEYDTPMGPSTFEQTVARFGIGDVLVHTWDVARATGGDERIDEEEAARLLETLEPMDELMRTSGVFGPKVGAPDGADVQTRLLTFTGRRV